MRKFIQKKTESLSLQAFFLIIGRFLSMPIAFLVPIVLVRQFSVVEFGQYKQLFMLFGMALPLIDFGITQGLTYFIPKYPEKQREVISLFVSCHGIVCFIAVFLFIFLQNEIAILLTGNNSIAGLIPYVGLVLAFWAVSTNLEVFLSAKKESAHAGFFHFVSECLKGIVTILIAYLFGGIKAVLIGIIAVGFIRIIWFIAYLNKKNIFSFFSFNKKLFFELLTYSAPLGAAVLVNTLIEYTHQVIISNQLSSADFAVYSIGCFQVPLIGAISLAVSRIALIKICELNINNEYNKIVEVLSNSFRKLSLMFFPPFVLLWTFAHEIVVLLYTDAYIASVHIFRIFIWILPITALLVEYTPRSLGDTKYNFKVNCITLLLNIIYLVPLLHFFGVAGAAASFVLSYASRKYLIILYLSKYLRYGWMAIVPLKALIKIFLFSVVALLPGIIFSHFIELNSISFLLIQTIFYGIACTTIFWKTGVVTVEEKRICIEKIHAILQKIPSTIR